MATTTTTAGGYPRVLLFDIGGVCVRKRSHEFQPLARSCMYSSHPVERKIKRRRHLPKQGTYFIHSLPSSLSFLFYTLFLTPFFFPSRKKKEI